MNKSKDDGYFRESHQTIINQSVSPLVQSENFTYETDDLETFRCKFMREFTIEDQHDEEQKQLALIFTTAQEQSSQDIALEQMLPGLSLRSTFKLIIALRPERLVDKLLLMSTEQLQLYLLIKSARHPKFLEAISKHLQEGSDYAQRLVEAIGTDRLQLILWLEQYSDAQCNTILWQKLSIKQMMAIIFSNGDIENLKNKKQCRGFFHHKLESAEITCNQNLLRNCTNQQVSEISTELEHKQAQFIEFNQMKLQFGSESQQQEIDLTKIDETRTVCLPKLRSWQTERPGTDQKQILVLNEYGVSVPCRHVRNDLTFSQSSNLRHELLFYEYNSDTHQYECEQIISLQIEGKVVDIMEFYMTEYEIGFLVSRFGSNDVVFLSAEKDTTAVHIHLLAEGQSSLETIIVDTSDQLVKQWKARDFQLPQYLGQHLDRSMLAYSSAYPKCAVNFFDFGQNRTILRVLGPQMLLYKWPSGTCIFNDGNGWNVDFTEALNSPELTILSNDQLKSVKFGDIIPDDSEEEKSQEKMEQVHSNFTHEMYALLPSHIEDWTKDGQQGIAVYSIFKFYLAFVVINPESHEDMKIIKMMEQIDIGTEDALVREFLGKSAMASLSDFQIDRQVATSYSFFCLNQVGSPRRLYVTDPSQQTGLQGFIFEDDIVAFSDCEFNCFNPGFAVITANHRQNRVSVIYLTYDKLTYKLEGDWTITSLDLAMCQKQAILRLQDRPSFCFNGKDEKNVNFILLQSCLGLMQLHNDESRILIRNSGQVGLLPMNETYGLAIDSESAVGDHICTIRFHFGCVNRIFTIKDTKVIQWCFHEEILHIVDAKLNHTRICLSLSTVEQYETSKVEIVWSDSRKMLPSLDAIDLGPSVRFFGDQVVCLDNRLFCLKTCHELTQIDGQILAIMQDTMLTVNDIDVDRDELQLQNNPATRNIRINHSMLSNNIRETHQIGDGTLLVKLERSDYRGTWLEQNWVIMKSDGTIHEPAHDLAQLLSKRCEVQSFSKAGQCCLILTYKHWEKTFWGPSLRQRIKKVLTLQLNSSSEISQIQEFPLSDSLKSFAARDEILTNHQGEILRIIVEEITSYEQRESLPEYRDGNIVFSKSNQYTNFAYAGDFFCWTMHNIVQVKDVRNLDLELRTIYLHQHIDRIVNWRAEWILINNCDPKQLLQVGWHCRVNNSTVRKLANHLQITIKNVNLVYDLNTLKLVEELDQVDELDNFTQFLPMGIKLSHCSEEKYWNWQEKRWQQIMVQWSLQPSPRGDFIIKTKSYPGIMQESDRIYRIGRTFTSLDLLVARDRHMKLLFIDNIWATFGKNQSLLALFKDDLKELKLIHRYLANIDWSIEDDRVETENSVHPYLQRISFVLRQRQFIEDNKAMQLNSITLIEQIVNPSYRDILLRIGRLSPDFSLDQIYSDQESCHKTLKSVTREVIEALSESTVQKPLMRHITVMHWPDDLCQLTFMHDSIDISLELLEQKAQDKSNSGNLISRPVRVEMRNLSWFHRDRQNFIGFSKMLSCLPASFYSSTFIVDLLDQFWQPTRREIIRCQVIIDFLFIGSSIFFFQQALVNSDAVSTQILGFFTLLQFIWAFWTEIKQFRSQSYADYFGRFINYIDIVGLPFTGAVITSFLVKSDLIPFSIFKVLVAFASFLLLHKVFDWFRIFEGTSFYIKLVEITMKDILNFIILFWLSLLMFGLPIFFLSIPDDVNEETYMNQHFGYWLLDVVFSNYLVALGELNMIENFNDSPMKSLTLCFFFFSTFLIQITMLNMLIAIMGDSFDRATDNKVTYSTSTKLDMLSALASLMSQVDQEETQHVFMIIVRPLDTEGFEEEDWQGTIKQITNTAKTSINSLEQTINKRSKKLDSKLNRIEGKVDSEISKLRADQAQIKKMLTQLLAQNQ